MLKPTSITRPGPLKVTGLTARAPSPPPRGAHGNLEVVGLPACPPARLPPVSSPPHLCGAATAAAARLGWPGLPFAPSGPPPPNAQPPAPAPAQAPCLHRPPSFPTPHPVVLVAWLAVCVSVSLSPRRAPASPTSHMRHQEGGPKADLAGQPTADPPNLFLVVYILPSRSTALQPSVVLAVSGLSSARRICFS